MKYLLKLDEIFKKSDDKKHRPEQNHLYDHHTEPKILAEIVDEAFMSSYKESYLFWLRNFGHFLGVAGGRINAPF